MSSAVDMRLSGDRSTSRCRSSSNGHALHLGLAGDHAIDAVARDGAGRDRVDPDVVRRQLERQSVRHPDLPGLGRAVADAIGEARGGPAIDEMFTIAPPPAFNISGTAKRVHMYELVRHELIV